MFKSILEILLLSIGIVSSIVGIYSWASEKTNQHRLRWLFITIAIVLFGVYYFLNRNTNESKVEIVLPQVDTSAKIISSAATDTKKTDSSFDQTGTKSVPPVTNEQPELKPQYDSQPKTQVKPVKKAEKIWSEVSTSEKEFTEGTSAVLTGDVNISVIIYSSYCYVNLFFPGENGKKYKHVEINLGEEMVFESENSDYKFKLRFLKVTSNYRSGIFKVTTLVNR